LAIKHEHIKQAVDAIASRDRAIGRALDTLLGMGRIRVPAGDGQTDGGDFFFLFDGQPVRVPKFVFLNEGGAPIEERLLVKYGELVQKQLLTEKGPPVSYAAAARMIRRHGLQLMVRHEIDYAVDRLKRRQASTGPHDRFRPSPEKTVGTTGLIEFLDSMRQQATAGPGSHGQPVIYRGTVDKGRTAYFTPFPYTLDALVQVADINLEFFHVRFLLNALVRGLGATVFACVVNDRIVGMLQLVEKKALFYRALELRYIATLRGLRADREPWRPIPVKGVGRFLVACAWLLWRQRFPACREIVLDSELGARHFYESTGFQAKGMHRFVIGGPPAGLLKTILEIASDRQDLTAGTLAALCRLVRKHVTRLGKSGRRRPDPRLRQEILDLVRFCMGPRCPPRVAETAALALQRLRGCVAESEALLSEGAGNAHFERIANPPVRNGAVAVVRDERFRAHLENVFHLESVKRYEAISQVLGEFSAADALTEFVPRSAAAEELAWVHRPEYIERVAATAGKPLDAFDLDTQTTARSYEVACLAVGAVFCLLDAIWTEGIPRGFAAVRPPGHHAESDRAMGFCLFNNVALGARYLNRRYGVDRIMIVDIDAHHGNGTQKAFLETDEVLFLSAHQFPGFPGTGNFGEVGVGKGEGYTVNVPLAKGQGDRDFLRVVQKLVRPLAQAYQPAILLVSCGFDLWQHDRLGGMRVTPQGYGRITSALVSVAEEVCGGRIAFVMEGGYSAEGIRECGRRLMAALCDTSPPDAGDLEDFHGEDPPKTVALRRVVDIHRKYWPCLG